MQNHANHAGILSENLKTLMSSNYPTVQYFGGEISHPFLLTNVYKIPTHRFVDITK